MRLQIIRSKNAASLYVVKSVFINGKRTSKVVERLGTYSSLERSLNGKDPIVWAKEHVEELNAREKEENQEIILHCSPLKQNAMDEQHSCNGGYLFLQQIYYQLGIDKICREIADRHSFAFDLNSILSRLVYARIIFPASKLGTMELSNRFLEPPHFELQHIYRALEVVAKENDLIQSEIYKNSLRIADRNCGILYYDCTNYFFEIEQTDGIRQYGVSKEHRPSPIVQMGLFMDSNGIPLAFCLNPGNTNEQTTLKPLEEKIIKDFGQSKFIVCTDAGLASTANRKFNDQKNRAFVTTQSIKGLKDFLKKWALETNNWHLSGSRKTYDISKLDETIDRNRIYYKERSIKEDGLEQRLIITYSLKSRDYQRSIRNAQIDRAVKMIDSHPELIGKNRQTDFKRFIAKTSVTHEGEIAERNLYGIDEKLIEKEESFDGFYGICTNLEDDAEEIIKVNERRWQIEECFRIMKSEFRARPVFLSRDDRILAHFTTCFISLILYRILEKRIGEKFTCPEIIDELKKMNFYEVKGDGYIPTYTRTSLTDALHEEAGFRTDYQIIPLGKMRKIFRTTKK